MLKFAPTPTYTIPSKWDIIPVHASDRGTFKYCRRQWAWSSPSRLNLVPRAEVSGIRENLWFGTGIHYALERYYQPLREDPVVAWETWFNLEWSGGLVDASELHKYTDREPELVSSTDTIYRIRGLDELLPAPDPDHFMELKDLGVGMMKFYKEYAEANDNFTVVATEHDFSVPILDPDGQPLYMVDRREMPEGWEPDFDTENAFGPLTRRAEAPFGMSGVPDFYIEKQCHARGRMDMILQDNETGRYGVKDYKTASSIGDDYFRHLDLDEQVTTYLTLGEVEAIVYNLPYKNLEFIIYEALLKGYPKPPTITSRGLPSINRNEETTTAEMFIKAVDDLGIRMIYEKDQKMQAYYEWLIEQGDRRFVCPTTKWRNNMQRINARIRLYYETCDMLNPNIVCYPTPRKEYNCLNCVFRTPCLQAEDGSDYLETLQQGYVSNYDR